MAALMGHVCGSNNLLKMRRALYNIIDPNVVRKFSECIAVPKAAKKIKVPKRKKRDDLSILQALASTVGRDYDATSYKFIDDPFLIPTSAYDKKTFAMAKTAGKQAAQYVMQNYSQFFENRPMEDFSFTPEVYRPVHIPKLPGDTIDGLRERIHIRKTMMAYQSYQQLKDKGEEVPVDVQQDLLELLCFNNSKDTGLTADAEELYLAREMEGKQKSHSVLKRKIWDDHGPAETLFKEMTDPDARAYNSLLKGRAKHNSAQGVFELHKEMKSKGKKLNLEAYNSLISVCYSIPSVTERLDFMTGILREMQSNGLEPTINTFNNVLSELNIAAGVRSSRKECAKYYMKIINEMKQCGIEPSLASWFYLLKGYYKVQGSTSKILYEVLDYLKDTEFVVQHPDDYQFFATAMSICNSHLQDLQLAYKVDGLLNIGSNINLMGNSANVITYYFNFTKLLCTFEQIDTVMEYYDKLTPHVYTPSFGIMNEVLKAIDLNEAYQYIPRLWSDLLLFSYQRRRDLLNNLLTVMNKQKHEPELQEKFVGITDYLLEQYEADVTSRHPKGFQFTGDTLGECLLVCCNADNLLKAQNFFNIYFQNRHLVDGFPSENSLEALAKLCIEDKDTKMAMNICTVMADLAYSKLDSVVDVMKVKLELTEEQIKQLEDIL